MNPDLTFHLRSLTRCIYYVTDEEDVLLKELTDTLKKHEPRIYVFNGAFGMVPLTQLISNWTTRAAMNAQAQDIVSALDQIYRDDPRDEQNFYVITDPERWLNDPNIQRRLLNIIHHLHNDIRTIKILLFVGHRRAIPEKLSRYIEVVNDKGLTSERIESLVKETCGHLKKAPPKDPGKLFKGLTTYEIEACIAQSVILTKKDAEGSRIDPKFIADFRRRQLQKTDLVTHVDTSKFTFDQIGGQQRFKDWAVKTKASFTDEGQKFGLKPPRGVLAVGVWGCGKSLSVKAMGNAWKLPVVQLEMGKLRSSGVGESEANVYRAIRIIESVAPCVTGETEVTLADGSTRPIVDLWRDAYPEMDLQVMCWNEKTLRVEATKVTAVTRRQAEAFCVSAANGFRLNSTANHQHYVLRGGMPEWVRTDELTAGDTLAVPLLKYDGNGDCKQFHPEGMRIYDRPDGLQDYRRGGGGWRDCVLLKELPREWSTDLGWILGAIEGDGWNTKEIGLTNTSTVMLDRFERTLLSLFGLQAVRREGTSDPKVADLPGLSANPQFKTCWTSKVSNKLVSEFLRAARESILTAPVQVRAAFVAGWVDADGCISPNKVVITVKGPKLRYERRMLARQLIQSLGVVPSKFDGVNLEITGSRAVKLAASLWEHSAIKAGKAQAVQSSEIGFDRGMGFACGQLIHDARLESGMLHTQLWEHFSSSATHSHVQGTVLVSERHLEKYIQVFDSTKSECARNLKRLLEAECRWVRVTGVESIGHHDVYDLVCEGENTHSFIANGVITHNCVVWIDEAEKSLSGNASSAQSDAGTTSRTIGILSTWMQETEAQVTMAMTANSVKSLPVEFINRMDERFFFDMPSEEERVDILKIHLVKAGQDASKFNLADLADKAKNMVGREIEQAIAAAMIDSFDAGRDALDAEILAAQLSGKPRIFKTMADELKEVMEWVGYDHDVDDGIRARFASSKRSEHFKLLRSAKV